WPLRVCTVARSDTPASSSYSSSRSTPASRNDDEHRCDLVCFEKGSSRQNPQVLRENPVVMDPSSALRPHQKMNFSANCIIRGPPALLLMTPNVFALLNVVPGFPRRRLFVTLNASTRNSNV